MFGVKGSQPKSKKSILFDREQGVIELLVCKSILISDGLLLVIVVLSTTMRLTPKCSGTLSTTLKTPLWIPDSSSLNLLIHIVCDTLRLVSSCGTLYYYPLL